LNLAQEGVTDIIAAAVSLIVLPRGVRSLDQRKF
jgi:hypothetical protein